VIFSVTGRFFQKQFSGISVSCLRGKYMTGHLDFKVDYRGPLNPGSEEIGIFRDT